MLLSSLPNRIGNEKIIYLCVHFFSILQYYNNCNDYDVINNRSCSPKF